MNIKMICTDLDRTLLHDEKVLTDFTRDTILDVIDAGICFVPATGRPYSGVPKEILEIPGIRYLITSNGSLVYDRYEEKVLYHPILTYEQVEEIYRRMSGVEVWRELVVDGVSHIERRTCDRLEYFAVDEKTRDYIANTRRVVEDLLETAREHPDGLESTGFFFRTPEELLTAQEAFGTMEGTTVTTSSVRTLEVSNENGTKGKAMLWLADHLGIGRSELMGCGDAPNDLEMVQLAGLGVAPVNAQPMLREAADIVAGHNNEDGIAYIMQRILRGNL